MSSMDWYEGRLERQRTILARQRELRRGRRKRAQAVARVVLAVTLVVLAILTVGIGRRAMVVMQHAQGVEIQRAS